MCRAETATATLTTPSMVSITSSVSSSPSSISVFEEAATLNNEGVIALCQHDEDAAIAALTNSIRLMKRELSKPNVDLSSFQKKGTSSAIELPAQMIQLPLPLQEVKQYLFCEDEDEEALFNNAVSIPVWAFSDTQQPSDLDIHIYSAAVVFNLALAHQQLALKHKQERRRTSNPKEGYTCLYTANRNKAEKLYSVILKLLQDAACSQVRTGVMVKLAAIHNLHWLQYSSRDCAGCSSGGNAPSLQQMLSRFVQGIRQQDPQLARTFLEEDAQIQSLLMNVLWLKDQQAPPKVAPAA